MSDWSIERLKINSRVRSVLVTHYVDLGKLSFHVYPNKISLRGTLVKLQGVPGRFNAETVQQLVEDLGRIAKIRRVVVNFDNWSLEENSKSWVDVGMSADVLWSD